MCVYLIDVFHLFQSSDVIVSREKKPDVDVSEAKMRESGKGRWEKGRGRGHDKVKGVRGRNDRPS